MRALFLNPPSFGGFDGGAGARYQARREIRSFWYPVWLAYPAGLVKDSRLIDAPPAGLTLDDVLREAKGYDLIIIHTSTPTFRNDCKVAERLKESYPKTMVGFVGPHVMVLPRESLLASRAIDFVCTGEFDFTIKEIADGKPLEKVDGIAFLKNGTFVQTPFRLPIEDLDSLPFTTDVYARNLKIEHYYNGYLFHPYLAIHTGRGCKALCTFCLWPQTIGGRQYRTRSIDHVMEEVRHAKEILPQISEFFFDDDTFTTDLPRAEEIARRMGPLGLRWSANARANVPYETLKVMKDNGLRLLTVGFESGNPQILKNIKKGITVEGAKKFMKATKDLGILVHGAFILGLPGETPETMEETVRYAMELDPYSIQVSLPAPYPGTELYAQAVKEGWIKKDGLIEGGIQNSVISYDHLSSGQIFEELEKFYRRFYLRPRPILRILKEMLTSRTEFTRRIREGYEFFSFMSKRKEILE